MASIKAAIDFQRQGRLNEAEAECSAILAIEPENFEVLNFLGSIKLLRRNPAEARDLFERAIAAKPDFVEALSALAFVLLAMNLPEDALAVADKVLAVAPADAAAWVTRGNALSRCNRLTDGLASHQQALIVSPDSIEALIGRGTVLAMLGRPDEAVETLDRISTGPNLANLFKRAELMRSLGLFAAAMRDFWFWIKMSPNPLPGWIGMAMCASESCDWPGLVEPRERVRAALDAGQAIQPFIALQLSFDPAQHLRNA